MPENAEKKNNKYVLFLGCAIPYREGAYEISARKVLPRLGIEIEEMPEFNCCGLPIDPVSHEAMLALAARNLCMAEQRGVNIIALCPGCAGTLRKVNKTLKEDKKVREEVNHFLKEIGMEFKGTIEAKHIMQVLAEDVGLERIRAEVKKPLTNLCVTEHSGCHVLRPVKYIGFDDPENPQILKNLIRATGAKVLDYQGETQCCGAPIIGINQNIPMNLTAEKLSHMKEVGAQAVVTVCPFCHMMFDTNQPRIERVANKKFEIPALHYTQLLGLAMGLNPEELALKELRVDAAKLMTVINA
ncbi:MAG TPA: CoB--CoM heterodisulfide reductase iron-sulfur subunit B family protein [Candidatus Bathyarchaeia archaeon]|nr:CoB--CoM heterodisulfide reductase iron-sulfur subunit B family protein [Candidatus Bathyarchaeia archaeon]